MFIRILFLKALLLVSFISSGQEINSDLLKGMKMRSIGPAGMSGRITSVDVVLSNLQIMYAGSASGGLWQSVNGGQSWKPIFDHEKAASIGAVAVDQKNPDIIWVGTGEGNPRNSQSSGYGMYKSIDGGKTWQFLGLEKTRNIHRVIIHPENSDIAYVAAIGSAWGTSADRGVFKTVDGGKSWKKVLYVNEKTGAADLIIDPKNPNKLTAAMWEYRRWPWFFKSGGKGSGMYMTYDGGENWNQLTEKNGLPSGEFGRIGLTVVHSRPNFMYALIETKNKNGLYRSDDGGHKWKLINEKEEIGNRPFYYADIYADPINENRIYSLFTYLSMSEDGGKSFTRIVDYPGKVHPDHHAFWVHPENPDFIIEGNDGGLNISRDRGKTWRFVQNLPLAQFYHIDYDNEMPYNVYGGMQDNGSWKGPAYVWRNGGIRNAYWEELYFGDGFDVMPDQSDSRYAYAMSQEGHLARIDLMSGYAKPIKPIHPDGIRLRYHWNAGIAGDPFDSKTIYYGSQFVHKSSDRGTTWEIISPDLTTNDPSKQKQLESGGLTYDATGAENHTTILCISPSSIEKEVIWVGTDDGNVQLTRNGGLSWSNVGTAVKGVPKGCRVPVIHTSGHKKGEAFVVINDYQRDNWEPYVFHTEDYGKSWHRIVDSKKVWGYALSIVQDPVEENLLFLGTEFGLYFSINKGKDWIKWGDDFPVTSVMDLKIHPREGDLIVGTFGRGAYILDDLNPLREIINSEKIDLKKELHLFQPKDAVTAFFGQAPGTRFQGDAMYIGENRPYGAMINCWVKTIKEKVSEESEKEKGNKFADSLKLEVFDGTDQKIRTIYRSPHIGINRLYWDLDKKGVRLPQDKKPKKPQQELTGRRVTPGKYKIKISYNDYTDSAFIDIKNDPRLMISEAGANASAQMQDELSQLIERATRSADRIRNAQEVLDLIENHISDDKDDEFKKLKEETNSVREKLKTLYKIIRPDEEIRGYFSDPASIMEVISTADWYISENREAPDKTEKSAVKTVKDAVEKAEEKINRFFDSEWKKYKEFVDRLNLSPFILSN